MSSRRRQRQRVLFPRRGRALLGRGARGESLPEGGSVSDGDKGASGIFQRRSASARFSTGLLGSTSALTRQLQDSQAAPKRLL
ncbi:hypothetical protein BU23DRAFT_36670 [Bimuria novae-zelandiae CBS 107.79]|uniref:Uncharacterized protein n=1 Tax=Bimuria novae-zelandiae CBS 107.79 TaxID=1447943 RepID=A0A6A5UJH3_9PLEO|nr:hypothetical protein BU23DRAFT_36670 [Bimuria novae-zelandiae CBS 107.79]